MASLGRRAAPPPSRPGLCWGVAAAPRAPLRAPTARPDDDEGRALVERWRAGDRRAFAELFHAYRGLVYGVLLHTVGPGPDLDDVVQTAFVEVFRSLDRFEGRSRLGAWIARVALHVGYHQLRHRRRRPADRAGTPPDEAQPDLRPGADPHRSLEEARALSAVQAVLATLSPKKRDVFVLHDVQGLSQEEIAEAVGTNPATVRTRLFYARRDFWKKAKDDPVLAEWAAGARVEDEG